MHKTRNLFRAKTAQKEFRISNFMLFLCASCYRVFILQQPLFCGQDGADENRAAAFEAQHKAIGLPKAPVQQNLALKRDPAELLRGVGHLNGAKALQVAANGGGMGDDKGGLPIRERIQQLVDAVCHPGADLAEGLAVRIFEVWVFVLALPERDVLPGRVTGAALGKAGVLTDGKAQQLCGLERTKRRGRPDARDRAESVILKNCGGPLETFGRKTGVGAGTAALRGGMAQEKKSFHSVSIFGISFSMLDTKCRIRCCVCKLETVFHPKR